MPPHQPSPLGKLLALAQSSAESAMGSVDHTAPALLADSPTGLIALVADKAKDERVQNGFARVASLICISYEVTAAVLVLEAWMNAARPGERLDMTEPVTSSLA